MKPFTVTRLSYFVNLIYTKLFSKRQKT